MPLPNTKVDSFIHNHFNNGNGTLSVFSGSDLYSLYELYINDKIKDLADLYFGEKGVLLGVHFQKTNFSDNSLIEKSLYVFNLE